jgi:hypothetical protein
MKKGFVRLNELDNNIQSSIRYGTPHNFIGIPIPGYLSDKSIIISKILSNASTRNSKNIKQRWI